MAGLNLKITISDRFTNEGREFLDFLRRAARKHAVAILVSKNRPDEFKVSVPAKDTEKFDLFLQELMFDQGLYYYLCSVSNKREIARSVIKPIFQDILESRFRVTYPSLLRKHALEGSRNRMLAGEFAETTAQEYEMLLRRLKLKMISGYEFIRNLDDLLTKFMLQRLDYAKGIKSPKFNLLVTECGDKDLLRDDEIRELFNDIHNLRTRGLHRLERDIPDLRLSQISLQMYFFFLYVDEYCEAQGEKTVKFAGKRYRRIRYGKEHFPRNASAENRALWCDVLTRPCHDCSAILGEIHLDGCDMEECPRCFGQYWCCDCRINEEEAE